MEKFPMRVGVLPGAFDPITNGHLDLISRAASQVDKLIVGIAHNPNKESMFTVDERFSMINEIIGDQSFEEFGPRNIEVQSYIGLTVQWARQNNAQTIFRGIRDQADLHYEMQMANINRMIGKLETVFLLAKDDLAMVSSTYIKQIASFGHDPKILGYAQTGSGLPNLLEVLRSFVPEVVAKALIQKS